ncbi:MAG: hypothetical protein QM488_05550 [Rhizobiaceae bacterium]
MNPIQSSLKADNEAASCCGGPAPDHADACCVKDANAKAAGEDGCGCNSKADNLQKAKTNICCAKLLSA